MISDLPFAKLYIVSEDRTHFPPVYKWIAAAFATRSIDTQFITCVDFITKEQNWEEDDILIFCNPQFAFIRLKHSEEKLRRCKGFKVYIGFDDEYLIDLTFYYAQLMDLTVTFDPVAYELLKSNGLDVIICPHPVSSPDIQASKSPRYDISFVGMVDGAKAERRDTIERLSKRYPNCFFPGLTGERLTDRAMFQVYADSRINLNFTKISRLGAASTNIMVCNRAGFKGRPFEIGSVGGFCLSEFSPAIERWLQGNVEIDYFRDFDDLCRKVDYYLREENKRKYLSNNLRAKVLKSFHAESQNNLFVSSIIESKKLHHRPEKRHYAAVTPPPLYAEIKSIKRCIKNKEFRLLLAHLCDIIVRQIRLVFILSRF